MMRLARTVRAVTVQCGSLRKREPYELRRKQQTTKQQQQQHTIATTKQQQQQHT